MYVFVCSGFFLPSPDDFSAGPSNYVSAFGLGTSRQTVPGSTLETSNIIACCWSIQFREWFMLVTLVLGITVGQKRRATLAKV